MESKDIGPCTVCMIGSSLDMILDVTTEEIGLLHELESSFFLPLTNCQQWYQIPATQRTTTKVISKSQCGKNACLAFLGETNFDKVKVKLGGLGVNMQLHVWSVVFLLNS